MKQTIFFTSALLFISFFLHAQVIIVKGTVYDKDSITPMQFAYVVDKNSATGIVADGNGKFSLQIHLGDTLAFSYVGYSVTKVFTHLLTDSVKNNFLSLKIYLKQKANELKTVTIGSHSFSKEEKEYYKKKVDDYHSMKSNVFTSNGNVAGLSIDALYYMWSKKGKQLQKLSALYDQLLIDETKEARLSPERVRSITGNDTLDVKDFLSHCFLPDQFVLSASDYDLFFSINKYYKQYMDVRRKK